MLFSLFVVIFIVFGSYEFVLFYPISFFAKLLVDHQLLSSEKGDDLLIPVK
tara:strand:- start:208 stop:360 length:153 start_codon:yes stop_codon:yes gene_type:complete